jgi:tetratricopeptide (TPR) repeat protein
MTTVALNMIVGPGESALLKRCLMSFRAKEFFDEIVIVNTSLDSEIDKTVRDYGVEPLHFAWETEEHPFGDFGGARDFARKNTKSDKFMWLDTDDVMLPLYFENYVKMHDHIRRQEYKDIIVWRLPYALLHSVKGNVDTFFWRERIFDTQEIYWERPAHEMTFPYFHMVKNAQINNVYISHAPVKTPHNSACRNTRILKHEYKKDTHDVQTKYFLGRDSLVSQDDNEVKYGISLLDEILSSLDTGSEMLYSTAIELARMLAYGSANPRVQLKDFRTENILQVESYCRIALSHSIVYPEPYIFLGDVYFYNKKFDSAIKMWTTALNKTSKTDAKWVSFPMRNEVPFSRLAIGYYERHLYAMSLHYSLRALSYNKLKEYLDVGIKALNEAHKSLETYVNGQC